MADTLSVSTHVRTYPFGEATSPRVRRSSAKRARKGGTTAHTEDCARSSMMDLAIMRHRGAADERAAWQMKDLLSTRFDVDQETFSELSSSSSKKFLMAALPLHAEGSGICMANKSWLEFCGFGESDVFGKDPKQLLQGPLTTKEHKTQMSDFFCGYNIDEEVKKQQPRSLVVKNLVNYRKVAVDGSATNTVEVPFTFTLTVSLLQSKRSRAHFKIWQANMTDENDLTGDRQNSVAQQQMRDYIQKECNVDSSTADQVHKSDLKQFLIDPTSPNSSICMASSPWLSYCGLQPHDILGKTPKQLMQGQLTSQKHMDQMHDFFGNYDLNKEVQSAEPQTLVCDDLINYRKVSPTESVPFKFTLTVSLLKSEETGKHFKVWQSVMTNERDLTEEDLLQSSLTRGVVSTQPPQPQPTLEHWLSPAAGNTCFECVGESVSEVRGDMMDLLSQLGAHCELQSLWSIQASLYFNQAPLHINLVLCKPKSGSASHVASISRTFGSAIDFCDFCTQVQQAYSSQQQPQQIVEEAFSNFMSFPEVSGILGFEQWVFDPEDQVNSASETDCAESVDESPACVTRHVAIASHPASQIQEIKARMTEGSVAEEMMEAYVQTVDSDAHPSTRFEVAVTIAQLCCEKQQRKLFVRVNGGAITALRRMINDADAEIQRCAVSILLELVKDETLSTQDSVLNMCAAFLPLIRGFSEREGHPEIMRLAKQLLPFMTRVVS